jgi:hypothetical protein
MYQASRCPGAPRPCRRDVLASGVRPVHRRVPRAAAWKLLREAIEKPAAFAGLRLEPGLVDVLVRDCEGEPGALPLLSHALAETWRRRDGHVLTVEGYRATGGIRGAVARSADRLYDSLPPEERAMVRSVLLRLVTTSPGGDPVRTPVPSRNLLGDPDRERVVALLVRSRLVTAEEDTFEVAHEALARAWPRLQSWLEDDTAGQRIQRLQRSALTPAPVARLLEEHRARRLPAEGPHLRRRGPRRRASAHHRRRVCGRPDHRRAAPRSQAA